MIKCSGYSIYPTQIEDTLNTHPAISMSCVIGVPDDLKMEKIKAYIVLKEGFEQNEEMKQDIYNFCENNMARYSVPKIIEFRESLPLTKVGKIAYKVLEEESGVIKD